NMVITMIGSDSFRERERERERAVFHTITFWLDLKICQIALLAERVIKLIDRFYLSHLDTCLRAVIVLPINDVAGLSLGDGISLNAAAVAATSICCFLHYLTLAISLSLSQFGTCY